jgi:hypothetical protein
MIEGDKSPVARGSIRCNGWLTLPDDFMVFGLSVFQDMVHRLAITNYLLGWGVMRR